MENPMAATKIARRETLNLRIKPEERSLIDRAARAQGKNRTMFILEAARRAAEEALLDQTLVRVDRETYEHYLHVLDQPASGPGIAKLMSAKKPWTP